MNIYKYTYWIKYDNEKSMFVVVTADYDGEALDKIRERFNVYDYFLLERKDLYTVK